MPVLIPFTTSRNNQRLSLALDNLVYLFDVHWNSRDQAWYFDLREEDETLILGGFKVILGSELGKGSAHPFFQKYIFTVVDTAAHQTDAGYDELGDRIQLRVTSMGEQ